MGFVRCVERENWTIVVFAILALGARQVRAAVAFTEEALQRGLPYTTVTGPSFGVGVAFADLDSDGDPDVIAIGRADGVVGVFENLGNGTFADRSATSGIPLIASASGIVAGDYDGDGLLDLYFSNWGTPNKLVHNDGGFQFSNTGAFSGVDDSGFGTGCSWGDFDGDGLLDLYVSNRSILGSSPGDLPNRLYRNKGDGTFEDVAPVFGVDVATVDEVTFQGVFFDFDNDADADLFLSTDRGMMSSNKNRLFENVNGALVDISATSGADISLDSMGVGVGDFDGNGFQDLYCTNTVSGHKLLMNQPTGVPEAAIFSERANQAGVEAFAVGWGAAFFDYDNDGFQELYVCNVLGNNQFYECDGSWPCTDIADALGVNDPGPSFGVAIADVDDDGDVDLLVQNNDEPLKLYINHEGESLNWLKLRVWGFGEDRFSIGAQVRIRTGSTWQMRELLAGGNNYKGQNELTAHFGLNDISLVDELVVTWPGGATRTLWNVSSNQTVVIGPFTDIPTISAAQAVALALGLIVAGGAVAKGRQRNLR